MTILRTPYIDQTLQHPIILLMCLTPGPVPFKNSHMFYFWDYYFSDVLMWVSDFDLQTFPSTKYIITHVDGMPAIAPTGDP